MDAFVSAWESADVAALVNLLAEDAQFTMPSLPAWFRGREDVGRFFAERVFATPWRLVPLRANGRLGFACYSREPGADRFSDHDLKSFRQIDDDFDRGSGTSEGERAYCQEPRSSSFQLDCGT